MWKVFTPLILVCLIVSGGMLILTSLIPLLILALLLWVVSFILEMYEGVRDFFGDASLFVRRKYVKIQSR